MTDTRIGSIGIIGHGWLGRAMERTFPWARIYDAGRDNKDPRFDLWFTFIYPDARGCNSKCIPKDVHAWLAWAESSGFDPALTRALLGFNAQRYLRGRDEAAA